MGLETRQRISRIVQRRPRLVKALIQIVRLTQVHFTAGVVGVLPDDSGRILLVEHVYHPEYPWGLPGGWMSRRESPRDALIREFHEELGLTISVVRPLIIDNSIMRGHLDIAFLIASSGPVGELSSELIDYGWMKPDTLPPMSPFHQAAVDAYLARDDDGV